MIQAEHIRFPTKTAAILKDINFRAEKGKLIAIIGPNGAGKSSLLNYLANEIDPKKNCTCFKGKNYREWCRNELACQKAKFSQQQQNDIPLRVKDILLMGRYPYFHQQPNENDWEAAKIWMQKTEISHLENREYNQLSGGEKQRVHLARIFAQVENKAQEKLVFLDEPLNNLDIAHQFKILQTIKDFTQNNNTAITVLHDLNLTAQFADEVVLMQDGEIKMYDSPEKVFQQKTIENVYQFPCKIISNPITNRPYIVFG